MASALVTTASMFFSGVCIDTAAVTGFCAEHSAMVTAGEHKVAKIVAVLI